MPSMETLLDAMVKAHSELLGYKKHGWSIDYNKRSRQYNAFRERILRMDNRLNFTIGVALERGERILELEQQLAEKDAENQRLREALEVYANRDNWDTEAVAHDMETGDFPDVNGNTPTVDIRIELGVPIVWNWSDEGYDLAEKTLKELSDEGAKGDKA